METKIVKLIKVESRMVVAKGMGCAGMKRCWSKGTMFQ